MGFAKIFTIYVCMSMFLFVGTYHAPTGTSFKLSDALTNFLRIETTVSGDLLVLNGTELNQSISEMQGGGGPSSGANILLEGWNTLMVVWGFIKLLFDLWWIPVNMMINIQAPFPLVLISAVFPILFMFYLVAFIRGGVT